jgi:hypothetical protein
MQRQRIGAFSLGKKGKNNVFDYFPRSKILNMKENYFHGPKPIKKAVIFLTLFISH